MHEIGRQITLRNHLQESPLRVGIRQHDAGADLRPVFEHDASRPATSRIDLRDRSARTDLGTESARGRSHGFRDGAHATHHVPVETLRLVFAAAEQVKQQAQGGSGLIWAAMFAVHVVGEEKSFHFFRFVIAVEKITQAPGEERNQLRDFRTRDFPKALADLKQAAPAIQRLRIRLGRWLQKKWLQIAGEFLEPVVNADKRLRILRRDFSQLRDHAVPVGPPRNELPVGKGNLQRGITRHHAQAVLAKLQVANDLGPQHARDIRSGRGPASRGDFLGYAAAAHDVAALEHQRG